MAIQRAGRAGAAVALSQHGQGDLWFLRNIRPSGCVPDAAWHQARTIPAPFAARILHQKLLADELRVTYVSTETVQWTMVSTHATLRIPLDESPGRMVLFAHHEWTPEAGLFTKFVANGRKSKQVSDVRFRSRSLVNNSG